MNLHQRHRKRGSRALYRLQRIQTIRSAIWSYNQHLCNPRRMGKTTTFTIMLTHQTYLREELRIRMGLKSYAIHYGG